MQMPSKLLLRLKEMSHLSEVFMQSEHGEPVKLEMVKRVAVSVDADGPPMVELTMYSPDTFLEVPISDKTSEAICYHERSKLLGFLTTDDIAALRDLREELRNDWEGIEEQRELDALDKVLSEVSRQGK
jgi:hypothetical protein